MSIYMLSMGVNEHYINVHRHLVKEVIRNIHDTWMLLFQSISRNKLKPIAFLSLSVKVCDVW